MSSRPPIREAYCVFQSRTQVGTIESSVYVVVVANLSHFNSDKGYKAGESIQKQYREISSVYMYMHVQKDQIILIFMSSV